MLTGHPRKTDRAIIAEMANRGFEESGGGDDFTMYSREEHQQIWLYDDGVRWEFHDSIEDGDEPTASGNGMVSFLVWMCERFPPVPPRTTIELLGQTFRPMADKDYVRFSGMPPGSFICEDGHCAILLWDPQTRTLSEIWTDPEDKTHQRDWVEHRGELR